MTIIIALRPCAHRVLRQPEEEADEEAWDNEDEADEGDNDDEEYEEDEEE